MRHRNYMDVPTMNKFIDALTLPELKQFATQLYGKKALDSLINDLKGEMSMRDIIETALLMPLGLGDIVGVQVDRSKKPVKFKIIKRKGTGIGKIGWAN